MRRDRLYEGWAAKNWSLSPDKKWGPGVEPRGEHTAPMCLTSYNVLKDNSLRDSVVIGPVGLDWHAGCNTTVRKTVKTEAKTKVS